MEGVTAGVPCAVRVLAGVALLAALGHGSMLMLGMGPDEAVDEGVAWPGSPVGVGMSGEGLLEGLWASGLSVATGLVPTVAVGSREGGAVRVAEGVPVRALEAELEAEDRGEAEAVAVRLAPRVLMEDAV